MPWIFSSKHIFIVNNFMSVNFVVKFLKMCHYWWHFFVNFTKLNRHQPRTAFKLIYSKLIVADIIIWNHMKQTYYIPTILFWNLPSNNLKLYAMSNDFCLHIKFILTTTSSLHCQPNKNNVRQWMISACAHKHIIELMKQLI